MSPDEPFMLAKGDVVRMSGTGRDFTATVESVEPSENGSWSIKFEAPTEETV